MSKWTVADIPDQTGRRVLITGANSGIGYYAALELARKGAQVLIACRDRTRGEAALASLRSAVPGALLELGLLDLGSLASVRSFSTQQLERGLPFDVLINNAGVFAPPKRLETVDGFEVQFGTNVLGHFALTSLLFPLLQQTSGAPRIVTLASIAHKEGKLQFDDLQRTRHYTPMGAYQQSKLGDLLFTFEFDRRLRANGLPILSIAVHPGVANTALFHKGDHSRAGKFGRKVFGKIMDMFLNSQEDGALPILFAASSPDAVSGGYYGPQGFREMRGGDVGPAKVAPPARDHAAAKRLWQACEQLTGTSLL